jgi:hypothetical protein
LDERGTDDGRSIGAGEVLSYVSGLQIRRPRHQTCGSGSGSHDSSSICSNSGSVVDEEFYWVDVPQRRGAFVVNIGDLFREYGFIYFNDFLCAVFSF